MSNPIQLATLAVPLALQQGDVATFEGTRWVVRRNGVVIASVNLAPISQELQQSVVFGNAGSITEIFWSKPPMSINVAHTRVQINNETGAITMYFGDESRTFATWEEVKEFGDGVVDEETAQRIIAAKAYEASPDGADKTKMVGAQVSINPKASVPVVFTPPIEQ